MEWSAPAVVLAARLYGETDLIASVMTEEHGIQRGLVKGGASRSKAATWLSGNLVQVGWGGRSADQLGSFTAEVIYAAASFAIADPLALAMLNAVCATADGAIPEREAYARVFHGLVGVIPRIVADESALTDIIFWELTLLSDLGYGLVLTECALTGETQGLAYVSPRTGRAVAASAAGIWQSRLLPLPGFLIGEASPDLRGWRDGLRLTGHFLRRHAFANQHRPLPQARLMLYDRVSALADESDDRNREMPYAG